jgi:hypothetical protein
MRRRVVGAARWAASKVVEPHREAPHRRSPGVTKLPSSFRIPLVAALFVVFVVMPLGYYFKVYRLKQRGR